MVGQGIGRGCGERPRRQARTARRGVAVDECGQATVEAAVLVPVLFTALLLLLQPGILL